MEHLASRSFDEVQKDYLHARDDMDRNRLRAEMESVATTLSELATLNNFLDDSPLKNRVQNRMRELGESEAA